MPPPWIFVAVDSSGFARLGQEEFAHARRVHLQAWAHIKGQMMVGTAPGTQMDIFADLVNDHPDPVGGPGVIALGEATTDSDGRFNMDRVAPGNLCVNREFTGVVRGITLWTASMQRKYVTAAPGQTVTVSLGGDGRPVVGKVIIPDELSNRKDWDFSDCTVSKHITMPLPPMPPDVTASPPSLQAQWYQQFVQTQAGQKFLKKRSDAQLETQQYPGQISSDGRFRVEDVTAGPESIHIEIVTGVDDASHRSGKVIAAAEARFVVPEIPGGRSDEPMKIPDISMQMLPTIPSVGDPAPSFSVKTLTGEPLSLTDLRGQYVLLEFWATSCGPCVNRTPDLKALFNQTAKFARITMVSLSIDELPYQPKLFVDENQLRWTECFLGPDSETEKDYGADTEGIPSFWIIDPNGKIIAHPKFNADLSSALSAVVPK
jgi:peroxiredoxin